MPPVAAMQLSIAGYDGQRLQLHAPLAAHVNDKGCAFGGSLASMMTLASWGLVSLHVEAAGIAGRRVRRRQPGPLPGAAVRRPRRARGAGAGLGLGAFIATLRQRGRARAGLVARALLPDGGIATEFTARYVAIAKS